MITSNDVFKDVEFDSLIRNPCSPTEPDDLFFRGILINAPEKVIFKRGERVGPWKVFAAIPICGYYMLDITYPPKYTPSLLEAMRLVAVNRETRHVYTGYVIHPRPKVRSPNARSISEQGPAGMAAGGNFNPNLPDHVKIPETSGVYDVHVELGERDSEDFITSNVVTIEIAEEMED
jgi:hypothetical protein